MGAVSYLCVTKEVTKKVEEYINITEFSGGYFDKWGSSFELTLENDKIVLNLSSLGGCLSETAYNGWQNDEVIRSVLDGNYNGVFSQWHDEYPNVEDINYLIIKNEVIAIGQSGMIYWVSEKYENYSIEELKASCYHSNEWFFDYNWEIPTSYIWE